MIILSDYNYMLLLKGNNKNSRLRKFKSLITLLYYNIL